MKEWITNTRSLEMEIMDSIEVSVIVFPLIILDISSIASVKGEPTEQNQQLIRMIDSSSKASSCSITAKVFKKR